MSATAASGEGDGVFRLRAFLPDEAATIALGREISLFVRAGDLLLLSGDLGSGKSVLARAFIRALAPREGEFAVPSPTFTLVQTYDFTRIPVAHADLYRLGDPSETEELGLEELSRTHVTLVEWPDRLPALPPDRLEIRLDYADEGRRAVLAGYGEWAGRLRRLAAARAFLARAFADVPPGRIGRAFFQGDASARRYELISAPGHPDRLLMDMPERPDGPPLHDGKSYDQLVHLSTHIRAVWAVNETLLNKGYRAPRAIAHDLPHGLMLQEMLPGEVYGDLYAAGRMEEPLAAAVDVLATFPRHDWPGRVDTPDGPHTIFEYDDQAFITEARLLLEWFWPRLKGSPAPPEAAEEFAALWRDVLPLARHEPPVLVLRDFHSPNLIWLPGEEAPRDVGLIDTQDALIGPPAYDLASLLQDARFTIPRDVEEAMLARYIGARAASGGDFDESACRAAYAVMGAQRAAKVLGIFVRLHERDGKPAYLAHIPRVAGYLSRDLEHPALAALRRWFETHLPRIFSPASMEELAA